jgi:hypothetical protein
MIEIPPETVPVNRYAVASAIAAFFTLLSFCIAVAPIPFTGYVCYPSAAILGLVALGTGLASLAQLRSRNENGRGYALIGIWVGGLAGAASICAITIGILLFPKVVALIQHYLK